MTHPARQLGQRAVVLGASVAGLLAARVLAERFAEVVLLERDALPDAAVLRKGTPQAFQPHGLLARGRELIEQIFPGFTAALEAQGALCGDLQHQVLFDAGLHRLARFADRRSSGHLGIAVGRAALEAELRRRVLALPPVRAVTGVDIVEPILDAARQRVAGVRYAARDGSAAAHTLSAELVVDCTGRGSRMPAWLRSWGYEPAPEERVQIALTYTTAYFRRSVADSGDIALIRSATAESPRPAVFIAQEGESMDEPARWVVGLGGYGADAVEPTLEAMRRRALALGGAELIRITHEAEPLGPVQRHAFPHSQRRHYEKLAAFPAGLLVLGDALTSFNPIYGQGMTVAACQAEALREALAPGLQGLHRRFFRAAARVADTPWQLAVGADLALPLVPGPRPLPVRLLNRYVARLQRAAAHDPKVALAFLHVVHLLARPEGLMRPGVLWRVLLRSGGKAGAGGAGRPAPSVTSTPVQLGS